MVAEIQAMVPFNLCGVGFLRALSAAGLSLEPIERRIVDMFSRKATAVMTNVPGPREPVYFAAAPVRTVLVWAPTSGHIGMSVSPPTSGTGAARAEQPLTGYWLADRCGITRMAQTLARVTVSTCTPTLRSV